MFNAKETKDNIVQWIRDWFAENGPNCNAVIGISGGKDSSVVAALCVEALGKDRVVGVTMPNGKQSDIDDSMQLIKHLDIVSIYCNIENAYDAILNEISWSINAISDQTLINLPPRLRMTSLYAISQSINGRVANTCNYCEEYVGYSTRWGDNVGDFSPIADLLVSEVVEIGRELGLPENLIVKTPSDGLCGKTDEDNLGFTYQQLEDHLNRGTCGDSTIDQIIEERASKNAFKRRPIPYYCYYRVGIE